MSGMKRVLTLAAVCLIAITTSAQWLDVPAHHTAAPKKGASQPAILSGKQLYGPAFKYDFQRNAYRLAAKVADVLYQQPCYCHCDRSVGHTSLRSCFESEHGAHCAACMQEAVYAYQMTKAKKTPEQIRAGIIAGEWQKIDLRTSPDLK